MPSKHERYYGLDMNAMLTVCSRNTNVIIVWAWMAERSRTALCCEYGHKMVSGSLASAQNLTPVSKIELLQPPQNHAITPGWREKPAIISKACWVHVETVLAPSAVCSGGKNHGWKDHTSLLEPGCDSTTTSHHFTPPSRDMDAPLALAGVQPANRLGKGPARDLIRPGTKELGFEVRIRSP